MVDNLREESARILQQCFLERTVSAYIQCIGRSPGKAASKGAEAVKSLLEQHVLEIQTFFKGHAGAEELQKNLDNVLLAVTFVTDPLESFANNIEPLLDVPCLTVSLSLLKALVSH